MIRYLVAVRSNSVVSSSLNSTGFTRWRKTLTIFPCQFPRKKSFSSCSTGQRKPLSSQKYSHWLTCEPVSCALILVSRQQYWHQDQRLNMNSWPFAYARECSLVYMLFATLTNSTRKPSTFCFARSKVTTSNLRSWGDQGWQSKMLAIWLPLLYRLNATKKSWPLKTTQWNVKKSKRT